MMNSTFLTVSRCLLFIFLLYTGSVSAVQSQDLKTEILWDNYGVPHIYGKNAEEMYYAFGWAQMNNHSDLILQLYGQARGRASEYWGKKYLDSDKEILLFNLPEQAKIGYTQQDAEYKTYLDAFVKGINDYATKNTDIIGESYRQVLPVTVYDVFAHTMRVTCLEFLASNDIYEVKKITDAGSNAIAIGPSKSESKNAMLITNPHLPWSDFFTLFEAHLNTNGFNAYGVAFVGIPSLSMAFNNNLGWAHTVNPIDASDRYELTLKGDGYLLDNTTVPFEKKVVLIKVKKDNGKLGEEKIELKYSKHGPVVGTHAKKGYAVRIAGLKNYRIFEQYHKMAKAATLPEFELALRMLQNPLFNVIYADKSGNILYVFNGNVPKRPLGDFAFWRNTIDGSDSKLIWQKIHVYEELPRVLNPIAGFLQNCNEPPWTCTNPPALNPKKFPAYMAPSQGMPMRSQRAMNLIIDNPSISFDQLIGYKLNTGMESAERFMDDLIGAIEKAPDTAALKAIAVLKKWDRKTDNNSKGAVLFAAWWDGVRSNLFETQWSPEHPFESPDGLKYPKLISDILVKAAIYVRNKYGAIDVAWGDVYRFRMDGIDYPANGGPDQYGIFRTIYYTEDPDNKKYAVAGDTYVAITEFGKKVRAQVLLSYGNATQLGNKHVGDQLKMMSEKKLRPALLEMDDILKNLEGRETF